MSFATVRIVYVPSKSVVTFGTVSVSVRFTEIPVDWKAEFKTVQVIPGALAFRSHSSTFPVTKEDTDSDTILQASK